MQETLRRFDGVDLSLSEAELVLKLSLQAVELFNLSSLGRELKIIRNLLSGLLLLNSRVNYLNSDGQKLLKF